MKKHRTTQELRPETAKRYEWLRKNHRISHGWLSKRVEDVINRKFNEEAKK